MGEFFDIVEDEGDVMPPAYAWRTAVILRKADLSDLEPRFLEAYSRHFGNRLGTMDAKLEERLGKLQRKKAAPVAAE